MGPVSMVLQLWRWKNFILCWLFLVLCDKMYRKIHLNFFVPGFWVVLACVKNWRPESKRSTLCTPCCNFLAMPLLCKLLQLCQLVCSVHFVILYLYSYEYYGNCITAQYLCDNSVSIYNTYLFRFLCISSRPAQVYQNSMSLLFVLASCQIHFVEQQRWIMSKCVMY